jgi:hypothetical protein
MAVINLDPFINWAPLVTLPPYIPGALPDGFPLYPGSKLACNAANLTSNSVFVCDDNSATFFLTPNGAAAYGVADFYPYVVDGATGRWTSYAAPASLYLGAISNLDAYGNGRYTVTDNDQGRGTGTKRLVANLGNGKINNPSPIVLPDNTQTLLGPCGEPGPPKAYFDPILNVIAYGYYGTQGQFGGSISGQTFTVDSQGNQHLNTQGPIGAWNSQTGQDDFDHTDQLVTGGRRGLMSNGIRINADQHGFAVGSASISVFPGTSQNCNTGLFTHIQAKPGPTGSLLYPYVADTGAGDVSLTDTTIPNLVAVITFGVGSLQCFAPNGFIATATNASAPLGGSWATYRIAITRKYMFAINGDFNSAQIPLTIYRAFTPAPLLNLLPIVYRTSHFASNYVRPISLTGRYKA